MPGIAARFFCDVTAIWAGNNSKKKYLPVGGHFMFIIGNGRCVKDLLFKFLVTMQFYAKIYSASEKPVTVL